MTDQPQSDPTPKPSPAPQADPKPEASMTAPADQAQPRQAPGTMIPGQPDPGFPPAVSNRDHVLPWVLTALLAALCVFFATMWGVASNDLDKARRTTSTTSVTAPAPEADAGGGAISAQPTTSDQAKKLLALARRQPDDFRAMGKVDAPIVLIEWADFRCPFCSKWSLNTLPQLKPYLDSGSLRIEFRDMALFDEPSVLAAAATHAAGTQGKYWDYSTAIWKIHTGQGHPDFTTDKAVELAKGVGVADLDKFKKDLDNADIKTKIQQETSEASSIGIRGTPFFLINSTPISGALPASEFIKVIEQYGGKK